MDLKSFSILLTLLQENSIETLLLSLFVFVLVPLLYKKLQDILKHLFEIKTEKQAEKEHFQKSIRKRLENSELIHMLLDDLLISLNADRGYVFEYHNGGASSCGVPFTKFSNTYERTSLGTKPRMKDMQNLPVSMTSYFNKAVIDNDIVLLEDVDELQEKDPSTYYMLKDQGVKSAIVYGLLDVHGTPFGFVGIDFNRNYRELDASQITKFQTTALKICGLLLEKYDGLCYFPSAE